jgi:hypothetical protein
MTETLPGSHRLRIEDVGSGVQRAPTRLKKLLVLIYGVAVSDMLYAFDPLLRPVREDGDILRGEVLPPELEFFCRRLLI